MVELDYKKTLNLPKTKFPMKADLPQREPKTLAFWKDINLYEKCLENRSQASSAFILNDGPPYANGNIHIGHALNKILKDIIIKSKLLSGYYSPYIPGWDCHGLPIELQVEKKVGKPGDKVDVATFRQKCREYAAKQVEIQKESFQRLGVIGDWKNPYLTMDYQFEADIVRLLGRVIEKGHLSQGDRPVHWCVNCGSALAEAEVEYMDKESPAIDVAFEVEDAAAMFAAFKIDAANLTECSVNVLIWTTTPWTLPANQAISVHPEVTYALVRHQDRCYVLAEALVASAMERYGIAEDAYSILGTCQGTQLEKLKTVHPFYEDRRSLIILGEHVTTDAGTGCVHTAPAHGQDDYLVCQHYKIDIYNPVDSKGCFYKNTPLVGGHHVFKANELIIELLKERDKLIAHVQLTHSYPHCWRHKTPLIFRATKQWFVSMEQNKLRETALDAVKKVAWIPDWGQARIEGMIAGRPDWCISRQRTWGTPLTLLVHKETQQPHPDMVHLIEVIAKKIEEGGIDAWFDLNPEEILSAEDAANYEKVPDTLDVWFDSGAVHACVAERRSELVSPVDLYLEGSDQHRGWFQTSLLSSIAANGQAPYREVLTHGFTVDAQGRKMSKSLGNVVAPEQVMKVLGADVLRLWVAATDYRTELNVSDEILKRTSDAYRRIRNTARFLLANLNGFNPETDQVAPERMLILDRWIVHRALQLQDVIVKAYDKYQFHVIYHKLHNFCVDELGSFYLDIIKDRQYTCQETGIPRRSAQTALYQIAQALVRWIAPILSFTAEEIWQHLPGSDKTESVFLSDWYTGLSELPNDIEMNADYWENLVLVRQAVNKVLEAARTEQTIGSGLEAEVILYCNDELKTQLLLLEGELRFVLITSAATVRDLSEAPETAIATDIPGLSVVVTSSPHEKCQRCWHRRADVGANADYPGICGRCIENLSEQGEQRAFA